MEKDEAFGQIIKSDQIEHGRFWLNQHDRIRATTGLLRTYPSTGTS